MPDRPEAPDLDRLRALLADATPQGAGYAWGWSWYRTPEKLEIVGGDTDGDGYRDGCVLLFDSDDPEGEHAPSSADAELICCAVNALPWFLAAMSDLPEPSTVEPGDLDE